jgi:hypothetical protein
VRRLIGPVLAMALLAAAAGTASAAPNRSASLTACTNASGVVVQVGWAGYHPDTLLVVATPSGGAAVTDPTPRVGVDWKFGTAGWQTTTSDWSSVSLSFAPDTAVTVDLYGHGKYIATTNAVMYGAMAACF